MKETEGTSIRINAKDRKRLNKALAKVSQTYHDEIPLATINTLLKLGLGLELITSEGKPWSGFLLGESSTCAFLIGKPADFGPDCQEVINAVLHLQWYRMQSGRYEITTYIS